MGEAWDDLTTFRELRSQCADAVGQLTAACAREHSQHKHVVECRECYNKVIDRIRSRYLDSNDEEWFSTREALRKELDDRFAAVREYKADLGEIDSCAEAERRRWYDEQVRASPSIRKSLEELLDHRELFAKIGAKSATFDEIVTEVREALEGSGMLNGEASTGGAEKALRRLMETKTPEERLQVYKETFFQAKPEEEISGSTQMYLDRLQDGATMDDIVNKIAVDRRSSIGALDRKEMHKKRIEDLRRARAAHELQKSRKASGRKDSNPTPQPPDEMYDQPPCRACGRELDLHDYVACPLCQVLVDSGVRTKPTVFCSPACFSGEDGQEAHVEAAHTCAGGNNCAQLVDEDIDMNMDGEGPFLCRECTDTLKKESVFCSVRCAAINFRHHREEVHIPARKQRESDVDQDVADLVYDMDDKSRYHARDIRSHLAPLGDLLADFQQRNVIEAMENIYPE